MTQPEPVVVTETMRQAVYAADCQRWGHLFDFTTAITAENPDPTGLPTPVLAARDPERLPHITCTRCKHVWLIVDSEGVDYPDAVEKVAVRLGDLPRDRLKPRPRPPRTAPPDSPEPVRTPTPSKDQE